MTKDEALRLALKKAFQLGQEYCFHADHEFSSYHKRADTIKAGFDQLVEETIKQALAQPEPEPVAFYVYKPTLPRGHLGNVSDGDLPWVYDQDPSSGYSARMLVYTSPPKREPQGVQVSALEFVEMVYEKEHLVGKPIVWAEWPCKEKK